MNYLSHLFFSQRTPLSLTGNLMGDFKRHNAKGRLPEAVKKGVLNHRFVDKCTDQNLHVKQLRNVYSAARRRYAGVISDIVFDYFLIKHWSMFEETPFDEFVDNAYKGLLESQVHMPDDMQRIVKLMCQNDWLRTYATLEGVDLTINQVAKRIRFKNNMAGAIEEIISNYQQFESVFLLLFPQLLKQVSEAAIER